MIRRCTSAVAALLMLATIHPIEALAGPYEDGDLAFRKKNYESALRLWRPAASAGHAGAQLGMATLYYSGLGVVLDYGEAFEWCAKAADQGQPRVQYMLGAMYRDGKGVEQDPVKAAALFRRAADHDVPGAQYSIGLMYFTGQGVAVDYDEAYYWLSLAASASDKEHAQLRSTAAYLRDQAAEKLNAQQIATAKKRIADRKMAAAY
jgi:TPR repeat protein